MGWLIKQPQFMANPGVQLYTLGQNKTIVLVGLGNVGQQYEETRHNIGFVCIDNFVASHEEMEQWKEKKDLKCYFSQGRFGDASVMAIKPTTFMNLSGEAVVAVSNFYKVDPQNILVIHDDIDIKFGQIRLRVGGSSAGHNGIESVSKSIGEAYGRLRIGIGPKHPAKIDSADFVLHKFDKQEMTQIQNLTREVNAILIEYIYGGQLSSETRSFLV